MSRIDEGVSFSLEVNVKEAYEEVRRLQTVLSRSLGLASRLTGSEDLQKSIAVMQRAIAIANQLRLALAALQAARMASGDPLAWVMAGLAVGEVGVSMYEMTGR
jgi:hypothetical protein